MPTTLSLTISDADLPRLQAAVSATGLTAKALIVAYLVSVVRSYESQLNASTYQTSYTPIGPS